MNNPSQSFTLHEALNSYAEELERRQRRGEDSTSTFRNRCRIVSRLKEHLDDLALCAITLEECGNMIGLWRNRPTSKKTGKPMAASTARQTLSELIRFFEWLDTSEQFEWVAPSLLGQISRTVHRLQSDRKIVQEETFSHEHLAILYRSATPIQRLMLCLAMNCGLGAAEMGRLQASNVLLEDDGNFAITLLPGEGLLRFLRSRADVYCEWLLWPETVEVTKWAMARAEELDSDLLFVSERETPIWKEAAQNPSSAFRHQWNRLLDAAKDQGVPRQPFSTIRKQMSERIREEHGDEAARLFLGHAPRKPSTFYLSNRRFRILHEALRQLRVSLTAVFEKESS